MLATAEHVLRTFAWTAFEIMGAAIIFALLPEWSAVVTRGLRPKVRPTLGSYYRPRRGRM